MIAINMPRTTSKIARIQLFGFWLFTKIPTVNINFVKNVCLHLFKIQFESRMPFVDIKLSLQLGPNLTSQASIADCRCEVHFSQARK